MDEQLDDVLARAAGDPAAAVDVDDVRRRLGRRRRRRLAGGGGVTVLVVGVVAVGAVMLGSGQAPIDVVLDPEPPNVASPADEAIATPSPGDRECPAWQNPSEKWIRWVDFVVFNGRRYEAIRREHELTRQDLGRGLGETVCRYSQVDRDAYGDPKHGDASLLPPGTPLFALPHTDTGFRLAAATDDGVRLYEVHRAPDADTGADVYDLDHVTRIEVRDWSSQDVLGALGRSEALDSLVADLRASRVVDHPHPLPSDEGARYRVVLHLSGGPPVELGLYPAHDLAWPLLHVPGSFTAAILDLLDPPSPTEMPTPSELAEGDAGPEAGPVGVMPEYLDEANSVSEAAVQRAPAVRGRVVKIEQGVDNGWFAFERVTVEVTGQFGGPPVDRVSFLQMTHDSRSERPVVVRNQIDLAPNDRIFAFLSEAGSRWEGQWATRPHEVFPVTGHGRIAETGRDHPLVQSMNGRPLSAIAGDIGSTTGDDAPDRSRESR